MPSINQLASVDQVGAGDVFPLYSSHNGEPRKATVEVIAAAVKELNTPTPDQTGYGLTVTGSTFNTTISPATPGASVWALLNPSVSFAGAQIYLPDADSRADGQEVLITCTQAVAALAVDGNDVPVNGAPSALTANGFFRMRYDSGNNAWFRVG